MNDESTEHDLVFLTASSDEELQIVKNEIYSEYEREVESKCVDMSKKEFKKHGVYAYFIAEKIISVVDAKSRLQMSLVDISASMD